MPGGHIPGLQQVSSNAVSQHLFLGYGIQESAFFISKAEKETSGAHICENKQQASQEKQKLKSCVTAKERIICPP